MFVCWLTRSKLTLGLLQTQLDDIIRFKRENLEVAILYGVHQDNGLSWDDDIDSIRGIESELRRRDHNAEADDDKHNGKPLSKSEHVKLVLSEQERLAVATKGDKGWSSWDFARVLCEFSSQNSHFWRCRATEIAKDDALAVGLGDVGGSSERKIAPIVSETSNNELSTVGSSGDNSNDFKGNEVLSPRRLWGRGLSNSIGGPMSPLSGRTLKYI